MDTVIGRIGGKSLLTIHFTQTHFMLAYLLDFHTARGVTDIFDMLYIKLGKKLFKMLFEVILTDNGTVSTFAIAKVATPSDFFPILI